MSVIPFPSTPLGQSGTIHVLGDSVDGFQVSHESSSGNSWGALHGPFQRGQEAVTAAHALNRDEYGGACDVAVCDAALQDDRPGIGLVALPEGF